MKNLSIVISLLLIAAPTVRAGDDAQAAYAYALALANARERATPPAPAPAAEEQALPDPDLNRLVQEISNKLDKLIDAKTAKPASKASATNPSCTCPNCGCGLTCTCDGSGNCSCVLCTSTGNSSPRTVVSQTPTQVCSNGGCRTVNRTMWSDGSVSYNEPPAQVVTYTAPAAVYATCVTPTHTHWSDGSISYNDAAPSGRARRCGPIRRLLGLCQ